MKAKTTKPANANPGVKRNGSGMGSSCLEEATASLVGGASLVAKSASAPFVHDILFERYVRHALGLAQIAETW
jgi:hypothetical protein